METHTRSPENLKKIEAILFAFGKNIHLADIARLASLSQKSVQAILEQLKEEYTQKDTSLMVTNEGDFWKFTVREEYHLLVQGIVGQTELDKSTMETLAVIAWKYPISQCEVIRVRGSGAYEHMKILEERKFIAREKSGRTYRIKLLSHFFDYFDLPQGTLKKILKEETVKMLQKAEEELSIKEKEIATAQQESERKLAEVQRHLRKQGSLSEFINKPEQ